MKSAFCFLLNALVVMALGLSGCGGQLASAEGFGTDELVEALREQGLDAQKGDSIEQPFFSVIGTLVNFNGEGVQVFEYDSAESMESDAVLVDAEGSTIGTSTMMWMATPHFYKKGRILVLYVGDDPETLDVLGSVLGPQFAGR